MWSDHTPNTFKATNLFIDGTGYTLGSLNYVSGGFPTGTAVTKYGAATGATTGTIQSVSVYFWADGVLFTNMVTATYNSQPGDSGGSIKASYNAGGLVYTYCAGVHRGRYQTLLNDYAVYTDMTNAKNALGFSGYYD